MAEGEGAATVRGDTLGPVAVRVTCCFAAPNAEVSGDTTGSLEGSRIVRLLKTEGSTPSVVHQEKAARPLQRLTLMSIMS